MYVSTYSKQFETLNDNKYYNSITQKKDDYLPQVSTLEYMSKQYLERIQ